ncbi:hypothetical protein [Paludisphaera mucosa]|uniref:Uncharacterized protein n=1 Tax=Paludisphaera mucosa TaxID=3030827 RepID=A0ABT6FBR3_9BACT|nr:hypothetical protein [Paludisphaera mucosa]MDG3004985.1 hypothetical protein [Paludisphaera mucosa]
MLDAADRKAERSLGPRPVVRCDRGEIDEKALLALAADADQETEFRCRLGFDRHLKGRIDEARANFRWIHDRGSPRYPQSVLAVAEPEKQDEPKPAAPRDDAA